MFIPVLTSDQQFSFQRAGNWQNYEFGISEVWAETLLSIEFNSVAMGTITSVLANKISISGVSVTIESSTEIIATFPITKDGSYFYHVEDLVTVPVLADGLYFISITDGFNTVQTDVFKLCGSESVTPPITASNKLVNSFIPIMLESESFSFQRAGNWQNYKFGIIQAPIDTVLSIAFENSYMGAITSVLAKKISVSGSTVSILSSTDITSGCSFTKDGTYFYHNGNELLPANLTAGLYYLVISDGTYNVKTDIFCVNGSIEFFLGLSDSGGNYLTTSLGEILIAQTL